jgi:hypothetical protein
VNRRCPIDSNKSPFRFAFTLIELVSILAMPTDDVPTEIIIIC